MSGRMTPISQGRSADNPQNYRQGTQGRHEEIQSSGWQTGQGGGIVQHFGPRTHNMTLVCQQPGTYNVGIRYFGNGNLDSQNGRSRSSPPIDRMPSPRAGPSSVFVPQSHNMASQTSPMRMQHQTGQGFAP